MTSVLPSLGPAMVPRLNKPAVKPPVASPYDGFSLQPTAVKAESLAQLQFGSGGAIKGIKKALSCFGVNPKALKSNSASAGGQVRPTNDSDEKAPDVTERRRSDKVPPFAVPGPTLSHVPVFAAPVNDEIHKTSVEALRKKNGKDRVIVEDDGVTLVEHRGKGREPSRIVAYVSDGAVNAAEVPVLSHWKVNSNGFSKPPLDLWNDFAFTQAKGGLWFREDEGRLYQWSQPATEPGTKQTPPARWQRMDLPRDGWRLIGRQANGKAYACDGRHLLELEQCRGRLRGAALPMLADGEQVRVGSDGTVFALDATGRGIRPLGRLADGAKGELALAPLGPDRPSRLELPLGDSVVDFLPQPHGRDGRMLLVGASGTLYEAALPSGKGHAATASPLHLPSLESSTQALALGWGVQTNPFGGERQVPHVRLINELGVQASAPIGATGADEPQYARPVVLMSDKGLEVPDIKREIPYDGVHPFGLTERGQVYTRDLNGRWRILRDANHRPVEGVRDIKIAGGAVEDPTVLALRDDGTLARLRIGGRALVLPATQVPRARTLLPQQARVDSVEVIEARQGKGKDETRLKIVDFAPVPEGAMHVLLDGGRFGTLGQGGAFEELPPPKGGKILSVASVWRSDDPVYALVGRPDGVNEVMHLDRGAWLACDGIDWDGAKPVGLRNSRLGAVEVLLQDRNGQVQSRTLHGLRGHYRLMESRDDRTEKVKNTVFRLRKLMPGTRIEPVVSVTAGARMNSLNPLRGLKTVPAHVKGVLKIPQGLWREHRVRQNGLKELKDYYQAVGDTHTELRQLLDLHVPPVTHLRTDSDATKRLTEMRELALMSSMIHVGSIILAAGLPPEDSAGLVSTGLSPEDRSHGRDLLPEVLGWWKEMRAQCLGRADERIGAQAGMAIDKTIECLEALHRNGVKMHEPGRKSGGRDAGDPHAVLWAALAREMCTFRECSQLLAEKAPSLGKVQKLEHTVQGDAVLRLNRYGFDNWTTAEAYEEIRKVTTDQLKGGALKHHLLDSLGVRHTAGAERLSATISALSEALRGLTNHSTFFILNGETFSGGIFAAPLAALGLPVGPIAGATGGKNKSFMVGGEGIGNGDIVLFLVRNLEGFGEIFAGAGKDFSAWEKFVPRLQAIATGGMADATGDGIAVLLKQHEIQGFLEKYLSPEPGADRFAALEHGFGNGAIGLRFKEFNEYLRLNVAGVGGFANDDLPIRALGKTATVSTGERGLLAANWEWLHGRFRLLLRHGWNKSFGYETHEQKGWKGGVTLNPFMQQGGVAVSGEAGVGGARAFAANPLSFTAQWGNVDVDKWTWDMKPAEAPTDNEWEQLAERARALWPDEKSLTRDELKRLGEKGPPRRPVRLAPAEALAEHAKLLTDIEAHEIRGQLAERGLSELQGFVRWEVNMRDLDALLGKVEHSKVGGPFASELKQLQTWLDQAPGLREVLERVRHDPDLNEARMVFEMNPTHVNAINRAQYQADSSIKKEGLVTLRDMPRLTANAQTYRLTTICGKTNALNGSSFFFVPVPVIGGGNSAGVLGDLHWAKVQSMHDAEGRIIGTRVVPVGAAKIAEVDASKGLRKLANKHQVYPVPDSGLPRTWSNGAQQDGAYAFQFNLNDRQPA